MYFAECARLAERHPDLAGAVEQVDAQLRKMRTAEVIRAGDLASFLGIDLNQVGSVLKELAQEGLLLAQEMVECAHCRMVVLCSEYRDLQYEEGEPRCTSCDRPFTDETAEVITTYRRGGRWKEVEPPSEDLPEEASPQLDELVTLSQVAPLTGRKKRTLERYLADGKLPDPDFRGGEGKSHKWYWKTLEPALSKLCNRILPPRFPGSRIV